MSGEKGQNQLHERVWQREYEIHFDMLKIIINIKIVEEDNK